MDDVDAYAPAKAFDGAFSDLPIYENFGYSIKSLASSVFRSTTGRSLSSAGSNNGLRKSYRMEQISTRIDNFLKSIFSENEELQYEQQVCSLPSHQASLIAKVSPPLLPLSLP